MTHEERSKKLSPVQRRFVEEYPIDFHGQDAYMRASGTTNKKSASVQASKLLNMPKVKEAIEMYVQETLGPKQKHLIENVDFWIGMRDNDEARPTDRIKASELLAKYQQMFIEKHDHNHVAQVQIVDDIK